MFEFFELTLKLCLTTRARCTVANLATERAEEAHDAVVLRRDAVDFGVVDETRLAERVKTRQSLWLVVRQLTDLTHHQLRTQLRRTLATRHH